jgi:RimJ/RimL family protein N-acetyltransferase
MIGDVNLFLNQDQASSAEIEVMIAEPDFRGQGYGKEALQMMMSYAFSDLKIHRFVAKISLKNDPSRRLFEKLGFQLVKISEIFQEAELHLDIKEDELRTSLFGSVYITRESWKSYDG